MNTIVVGYDGSDGAAAALARAAELAEETSGRLVVVSVSSLAADVPFLDDVSDSLLPVPSGLGAPLAIGGRLPPADRQPLPGPEPAELARRNLEHARSLLAHRKIEVDYLAEVGAPAERLLAIAEERDADLIVVGSREHGFVERLLAQPVDETLARHAPRDVLLVR